MAQPASTIPGDMLAAFLVSVPWHAPGIDCPASISIAVTDLPLITVSCNISF
jgi:hypothetical protein